MTFHDQLFFMAFQIWEIPSLNSTTTPSVPAPKQNEMLIAIIERRRLQWIVKMD